MKWHNYQYSTDVARDPARQHSNFEWIARVAQPAATRLARPHRLVAWVLIIPGVGLAAPAEQQTFLFNRQDSFLARVESLALLETLNAELLSHDSATLTLEHWCSDHKLAVIPKVVADRDPNADRPATAQQRSDLHVQANETIRYRKVSLRCGSVLMSVADNWYVPARLTTAMNDQLDSSDAPFGTVVSSLNFQRHTLSAQLLWSPLPPGWELGVAPRFSSAAPLRIAAQVLQHRALLSLPDGTPFSEVVETYSGSVLAFDASAR